jgi:hypothetical protein
MGVMGVMGTIKKDGAFDSHFDWWANLFIGGVVNAVAWRLPYGLNFVASTLDTRLQLFDRR